MSFVLNLIPYKLLTLKFGWEHNPAYAASLSFITLVMFFWNYRINFPTASHWRACAWRYLSATACAWMLNFLLVGWLKIHVPVTGAIFVVGFVIALFKFVLYNKWVFPRRAGIANGDAVRPAAV